MQEFIRRLISLKSLTAINNASGFECSISFSTTNSYGGQIGTNNFSSSKSGTSYLWDGDSKLTAITFPYGTPSVYFTNGPVGIYSMSPDYDGSNTMYKISSISSQMSISAKGSGRVKIYGWFIVREMSGSYSTGVYTLSSSEKPYILINISSGAISSIETNCYYYSATSSYLYLKSIDSMEVY